MGICDGSTCKTVWNCSRYYFYYVVIRERERELVMLGKVAEIRSRMTLRVVEDARASRRRMKGTVPY